MPVWLGALLAWLVKFLNITRRDVVVAFIVLLVCGFGAVLLAQNVVRPFFNRIDSQQDQIDQLKIKDVALSRTDSLMLVGIEQGQRTANTNLVNQMMESPFLTIDEKAKINTLLSWMVYVNGDSLSQLVAYRRTLQIYARK